MSPECPSCGGTVVYSGKGRPRKYCEACTPPHSGGAEWRAAWGAANAERLEAERQERYAAFMAGFRKSIKERKATTARNRRMAKRKVP
jgi:hypothetical protein